MIQEIGEAISSIRNPQELLKFITEALHKRLMFERSMVMLVNPERTKLIYSAGYGFTPHEEAVLRNLSFSLTDPESKGYFYLTYTLQKTFILDSKTLINGLIIVFTSGAVLFSVIFPAKAGIQFRYFWMPAFAGMTDVGSTMRPLIKKQTFQRPATS